MARTEYDTAPEVTPELQAPDDLQRIDVSPNAFGASLGEGFKDAGEGLGKTLDFYGQVAADNATNNFLEQSNKILYGDPSKPGGVGPDGKPVPDTGYFGKRGADAMSARAEVSEQLDELIAEQREGLQTPKARQQYDVDTRRYRAQTLMRVSEFADAQQRTWAVDTNKTAATIALNDVARVAADDTASATAGERVRNALVKNAQLNGVDPQGAILDADQRVALTRVNSLIVSDPKAAQRVFDANKDVLGSLPNYDQISRQVKEADINATMAPAVDKAASDALAAATAQAAHPTGPGATGATYISRAIGAQEWHGHGAAPTSVDGAVGPSQITPATARQYGLDPTKLNDPVYAAHAKDVIIAKISALPNVQGDPARIAVGYFSGAGNIAPRGSPTPYIHNYADGNGKRTASYVSDVMGRLGASPGGAVPASGGGQYPSTADALRANMTANLATARTQAETLFPNYPDAQDRYVQGVERRLNQNIAQQEQQYTVDTHIVQAALASGHINSEEDLNSDPDVARAWASVQINNPYAAMSIERRLEANSHGPELVLGTGFKDYLDRVLAPTGDPNRITNPVSLNTFVGHGRDAVLTNTGVDQLSELLGARGTPQGEAFSAQAKAFIDNMHAELTFSNASAGMFDPKGEERFNRFMTTALPILTRAYKDGNAAKLLDPNNPDYLGNQARTFARPAAEVMHDRLTSDQDPLAKSIMMSGDEGAEGRYLLKRAVDLKRLSVAQATQIGESLGYFSKAPPGPAKPPHPIGPEDVPIAAAGAPPGYRP